MRIITLTMLVFVLSAGTVLAEPQLLQPVPDGLYTISPDKEEGTFSMSLWENRVTSYMQFFNIKGLEGWCQTYVTGKPVSVMACG